MTVDHWVTRSIRPRPTDAVGWYEPDPVLSPPTGGGGHRARGSERHRHRWWRLVARRPRLDLGLDRVAGWTSPAADWRVAGQARRPRREVEWIVADVTVAARPRAVRCLAHRPGGLSLPAGAGRAIATSRSARQTDLARTRIARSRAAPSGGSTCRQRTRRPCHGPDASRERGPQSDVRAQASDAHARHDHDSSAATTSTGDHGARSRPTGASSESLVGRGRCRDRARVGLASECGPARAH